MDFDKSGGYHWLDSFIMASIVQLATIRFCEQKKFAKWLDAADDIMAANALLILISRTVNMLTHQIQALGDRFEKTGGFREQLTAVRTAERAKQDDAPVCPECGKPMHKRTARTGKNIGQEFWGCTGYPECKGVRNMAEGR